MALFGRIWTTFSPFKSSPFSNPKNENKRRHTLEPLTPSSRKRPRIFDQDESEAARTSKKRKLLEQEDASAIKLEPHDSPLIADTRRFLTPIALIQNFILEDGSPDSSKPEVSCLRDGLSSPTPSDVLESVERHGDYGPMSADEQYDSLEKDEDAVEYSEISTDATTNTSMGDDTNEATILDESTLDAKDTRIKVATGLYSMPRLHEMEQERARRKRNAERLIGWSVADKALSYKIAMRGLEPLIPANWHCEFPVLMPKLFSRGAQQAFIDVTGRHQHRSDEFWAMRYLTKVMELGPRVRDRLRSNLLPEKIMKQVFEDYIFWSLRDADVLKKKGAPTYD